MPAMPAVPQCCVIEYVLGSSNAVREASEACTDLFGVQQCMRYVRNSAQ